MAIFSRIGNQSLTSMMTPSGMWTKTSRPEKFKHLDDTIIKHGNRAR